MSILLYTDEDTTPLLARSLRAVGRDAISAHEISARGLTDEEQLDLATRRSRAIVSSNYGDFLRLSKLCAAHQIHHSGIIVSFQQLEPDLIGVATEALLRLLNEHDGSGLDDQVAILQNYWPRG